MDSMHFLLLPVLLTLSSQGRPSEPVKATGTPTTVNACSVISRAEIEIALGRNLSIGKMRTDDGGSTCEYSADGGQITISLRRSQTKVDIGAELANFKRELPDAQLRELGVPGTRTFVIDLAQIGAQINVFRGDFDYLLVSLLGLGDAGHVALPAERLARKALDRL